MTWLYYEQEEYEVYALWTTKLVNRNDGTSRTVRYGEHFNLGVPIGDDDFDGWYIMYKGVKTKITDQYGESLAVWFFEGKEEFDLLTWEGE